jgi:hypothetical protein
MLFEGNGVGRVLKLIAVFWEAAGLCVGLFMICGIWEYRERERARRRRIPAGEGKTGEMLPPDVSAGRPCVLQEVPGKNGAPACRPRYPKAV